MTEFAQGLGAGVETRAWLTSSEQESPLDQANECTADQHILPLLRSWQAQLKACLQRGLQAVNSSSSTQNDSEEEEVLLQQMARNSATDIEAMRRWARVQLHLHLSTPAEGAEWSAEEHASTSTRLRDWLLSASAESLSEFSDCVSQCVRRPPAEAAAPAVAAEATASPESAPQHSSAEAAASATASTTAAATTQAGTALASAPAAPVAAPTAARAHSGRAAARMLSRIKSRGRAAEVSKSVETTQERASEVQAAASNGSPKLVGAASVAEEASKTQQQQSIQHTALPAEEECYDLQVRVRVCVCVRARARVCVPAALSSCAPSCCC